MSDDTEDHLVLITTFIVPAAMETAFLTWWRMLKFMSGAQPGFISATLHRSLDERERYRFINVATWRATEAERDVMQKLWSSVPMPPIPGFQWHPAIYEVVEQT